MADRMGFYMDMKACYGCQTCEIACKSENKLPQDVRWRRVRFIETERPQTISTLSMACNHCEDPQCLIACPTGAYSKRPDGIVVQDHNKCIGCQICIMACPYGAPVYDPVKGKTSKCDLCAERLDQGLEPKCVEACPCGAIEYGKLSDIESRYGKIKGIKGSPEPSITNPSIAINPTDVVK